MKDVIKYKYIDIAILLCIFLLSSGKIQAINPDTLCDYGVTSTRTPFHISIRVSDFIERFGMNKEIWKQVKIQFKGNKYFVSNYGNMKRLRYYKYKYNKGKVLYDIKPTINVAGYCAVLLNNETHLVHRLVAECFIFNPQNLPCVNHLDSSRDNNYYKNLEWCTYKRNTIHAFENGKIPCCENHPMAKLKNNDVVDIRKMLKDGMTRVAIAKKYNVTPTLITNIKLKKIWRFL